MPKVVLGSSLQHLTVEQKVCGEEICGMHTCERVRQLRQFPAKYLAKGYLEKFRADDKMTLMNLSNLVQQDDHMTTSRSKLACTNKTNCNEADTWR